MASKRDIKWLLPVDTVKLAEIIEKELPGSQLVKSKRVYLEEGHVSAGLMHIVKEHLPEFKAAGPQVKVEADISKYIEDKMKTGTLLYSTVKYVHGKRKLLAAYEISAAKVLIVVIGTNGFVITAFPFDRANGNESTKYDPILTNRPAPKKEYKPPKRMIRVSIWDYKGVRESLGHASLTLSDGTHISWWPILKNDSAKKGLWTAVKSVDHIDDQPYLEDVWGEERRPDKTIEFNPSDLDEDKIRSWWQQFKEREKYNLRSNNCSTVVFKALIEGGAEKYLRIQRQIVWYPEAVKKFSLDLLKAIRSGKKTADNLEMIEATKEFLDAMSEENVLIINE